jgi:hypothetical protein
MYTYRKNISTPETWCKNLNAFETSEVDRKCCRSANNKPKAFFLTCTAMKISSACSADCGVQRPAHTVPTVWIVTCPKTPMQVPQAIIHLKQTSLLKDFRRMMMRCIKKQYLIQALYRQMFGKTRGSVPTYK